MIKPLKVVEDLKKVNFLLGFVSHEILIHFDEFVEKAFLRFGRAGEYCRLLSWRYSKRRSTFYEEGNFTEGLESLSKKNRFLNYFQIERLKEARERLNFPIYPSKDFSKIARSAPTLYFVTNSFPHTTSGYAVRTENVAFLLRRNGIPVRVCTRAGYPLVVGRWERETRLNQRKQGLVRLMPWRYCWNVRSRRRQAVKLLEREARNCSAQLIITTTSFEKASVVSEVARNLNIPWVYEVRGEPEATWLAAPFKNRSKTSEFYARSREKENEAVAKSGAQIFLSRVSQLSFAERGVSLSRPIVLPNAFGVDESLNEETPQLNNSSLLNTADEIVVGSVSSLVGYEGFDILIDALALTDERFKVLLVGGGGEKTSLEKRVADLGLQDRVRFAGPQPHAEIGEWYKKLDIFVLPRRDHAVTRTVTPIKHFEAMARGIPVVASDLPALREATGGLASYFPTGDANQLSRCLNEVARGKHQARSALLWVKQRTWTNVGGALISDVWTE